MALTMTQMTPNAAASETDWGALRALMVEKQIESRGISNPRLLKAMRSVPRHLFVPEVSRQHAYEDRFRGFGDAQDIIGGQGEAHQKHDCHQ